MDHKNRRLFIQSGWLKRLNQMSYIQKNGDNCADNSQIHLIRELISHKILFNLNQGLHEDSSKHSVSPPLFYSTMLYPLNPIDSDAIKLSSNTIDYNSELMKQVENHKHVVDVVFVHGLRGSLFKTWRQDSPKEKEKVEESSLVDNKLDNEFTKLENKILDKLNTLIEEIQEKNSFSYCWPKDWLCNDLNEVSSDTSFRLIGVNYESLFSSWEEEKFDDKKLKLGIKERAIDLVEQLKNAHVGQRPIIWVIIF